MLRVPSIWLESTASRRTYIATNRSGFGTVVVVPSSAPRAVAASASRDTSGRSKLNGGCGGSGAGTNASYPEG